MKPEIFIRADGSSQIGLGHLVRCLSLAQILKKHFDINFFCKEIPSNIEEEILKENFALTKIEKEESFLKKLTSTTLVVLDGYHFDLKYQEQVKYSGCILVVIDDIAESEYCADLIINHSPGIKKDNYLTTSTTEFALGPDYALLRYSFLQAAKKERRTLNYSSAMICFGGSDVKNLTQSVLDIIVSISFFKRIIVITGAAYGFRNEMAAYIKGKQNIEYFHNITEVKMMDVMLESGIAFIPSSGILFEALACGNICISGAYNENQKLVYSGFKNLGAIIDAGTFKPEEINTAIKNINKFQAKNIIDGKSPERILKLFKKLYIRP